MRQSSHFTVEETKARREGSSVPSLLSSQRGSPEPVPGPLDHPWPCPEHFLPSTVPSFYPLCDPQCDPTQTMVCLSSHPFLPEASSPTEGSTQHTHPTSQPSRSCYCSPRGCGEKEVACQSQSTGLHEASGPRTNAPLYLEACCDWQLASAHRGQLQKLGLVSLLSSLQSSPARS